MKINDKDFKKKKKSCDVFRSLELHRTIEEDASQKINNVLGDRKIT